MVLIDPITAQSLTRLLVQLGHDRNYAPLLVSHDPDLIAKTCDRQINLQEVLR